jgi:beta-galactosidase/beta-glucuronidase
MDSPTIHPRPQLTRPNWVDLNGVWGFAFDDANQGLSDGWINMPEIFTSEITVPFPPESQASGIGDQGMRPVVWYRREFELTPDLHAGRLLLHFGAVDYRAQVWVNGALVATHEGGHTPFTADITTALNPDADTQVIVVRAEDIPDDLAQPRGKQFWEAEPRDIWYTRTTGIWQPVWLEPVPETYITAIRWTPQLDRGQLGMRLSLNQTPRQTLTVRVQLTLHDVTLVDDRYTVNDRDLRRDLGLEATRTMNWRKVIWSPDYPNLIDAVITLLDGDRVIDEVRSYAGLRTVGVENGYFLLNGSPIYLRLVLAQNYWEDTNLTPPTPDALREEVRLIKSLGFNGVRIHQKVEDPRFLYWCDRLGVMVWGEMANAFVFSPTAIQRLTREWMDVLERDYSHPCIICWVPLNESWGVPNLAHDPAQQSYVAALYHLTRALDPTRPVIGNDGWEHIATDVLGIHDYAIDGQALRDRYGSVDAMMDTLARGRPQFRRLILAAMERKEEPIMLTECGGVAFAPDPGKPWFGYGTVSDSQAYLAKYEELINAILDSPMVVGFCYTQLTDVQQEVNGLLTADRKPKHDLERLYEITRRPSKALPGEVLVHIHQAAEAITYDQGTS